MRALQISAYGDPLTVLELVDIPEPGVPGAGEVLLRTYANRCVSWKRR
jgi:NADPH:quinone reductase-like Zn-dependent oxidoreductase